MGAEERALIAPNGARLLLSSGWLWSADLAGWLRSADRL
jgi:hypothetical protein